MVFAFRKKGRKEKHEPILDKPLKISPEDIIIIP
jgi:hypothetical protein